MPAEKLMGMKERGGRLATEVIPDVKKATLRDVVNRNVEPGSVKHGGKEWSYYDYRHGATHSTNSVEAFWRLFKDAIRSTHIHVSGNYMDRYLSEFSFPSNHREMKNAMFGLLIGAI